MFWETVTDSCDVCDCTRLFKNAFRIKSTPERTAVKSARPKARRLLGMASRRLGSPEMEVAATASPSVDKENGGSAICGTPTQSSSPQKISSAKKCRLPLEDCDPNSQDSGYGASYPERDDKGDGFQFAEPLGVAPRRLSIESRGSPMQSPVRSSPQSSGSGGGNRRRKSSLFRSLSSGYESTDDGFNELIDMDSLDEATQLPNGLTSLLSGHIVAEKPMECDASTTPEYRTKSASCGLRRSLSLQNATTRPEKHGVGGASSSSRVRSCLFRSPNATSSVSRLSFDEKRSPRSFKRPDPPCDASPVLVKRSRKCTSFQDIAETSPISKPTCLQRSHSETEAHAHIKSAIHRSTTDADLTGDFSKPCVLPLASGNHEDLKSISAETLAALIRGDFRDRVASYRIVDCRYPYEYDGGHIDGALNLYSKDLIEQILLDPITQAPRIQSDGDKRSILVFHCEFSWERGPNLSRFLRNIDRQRNKEHYPALHYPEMYLLHGGYEQFYREHRLLCSPQGYRPMRDPEHEADLRQFRSKSKSWQAERNRASFTARANLKRLGF